MATFKGVPVIEVHSDNFRSLWPSILLSIKTSTFIAIDAELSGLGNRKLINAKSIDVRYKEICEVAKSRSVISLGLSCFKLIPSTVGHVGLNFQVQTFNITLLCSEEYVVEPLSLKFLVEHGFDFNKQCAKGIPYYRGPDKEKKPEYHSIRWLFSELVTSAVPIVLHNALVDLVFLYQNFYTTTPSTIEKFTADLCEIFAGGIFDTKYIAEFKYRFPASYLEYVFRKSQRDNCNMTEAGKPHVRLVFPRLPNCLVDVYVLPCGLEDSPHVSQEGKLNPCKTFAAHGWCSKGNNCKDSHDIDIILDSEDTKRKRKQKKKPKSEKDRVNSDESTQDCGQSMMETSFEFVDTKEIVEMNTEASESTNDDASCNHSSTTSIEIVESVQEKLINDDVVSENGNATEGATSSNRRVGGHRAGFDSFMTGFAFAYTLCQLGGDATLTETQDSVKLANFIGVQELVNKAALSGKDFPLLIQKGNFAKTSQAHNLKMEFLRSKMKEN